MPVFELVQIHLYCPWPVKQYYCGPQLQPAIAPLRLWTASLKILFTEMDKSFEMTLQNKPPKKGWLWFQNEVTPQLQGMFYKQTFNLKMNCTTNTVDLHHLTKKKCLYLYTLHTCDQEFEALHVDPREQTFSSCLA